MHLAADQYAQAIILNSAVDNCLRELKRVVSCRTQPVFLYLDSRERLQESKSRKFPQTSQGSKSRLELPFSHIAPLDIEFIHANLTI